MRTCTRILLLLLLAVIGVAGCAQTRAPQLHQLPVVERTTRPQLEFAPSCEAQEPSTLQELITVALKHHPDLRAAEARIEGARGRMIQAGLHPNPWFGPNFSQLGDTDNRLGEPGARLTQTIVPLWKLRIAKSVGAAEVEAADWQAVTKSYDVVTRVRIAYFELLTAQRERDTLTRIVGVSAQARKAAASLEKAGVAVRPDVLRANVELEQNQLKREVSLRRVEAAKQNLLTALGRPPLTLDHLDSNPREMSVTPPAYEWKAMLDCLHETSSELQEARAIILQSQRGLTKARSDVAPNYNLIAVPFYEAPQKAMHAEVILTATIPIFDRNQGNIHTAQAEIARTLAAEKQLELLLTERLTNAFQRYQATRKQVETYRDSIVPEARESLRLIEAGYQAQDKKYDYTAVLQAQQVLFQAELSLTQVRGDMWRSIAEIAGILQQDDLLAGCAIGE